MEYNGRTPAPPLGRFIERIWYCSATPSHTLERVVPGGGALDLIVNLQADEVKIFDPDVYHSAATWAAMCGVWR